MDNILLRMSEGNVMNTANFALLHENILTNDGIIEGCEMTIVDETTSDAKLHITAGELICHGRVIKVLEHTINLTLASPTSSSEKKCAVYLYINIDETSDNAYYESRISSCIYEDEDDLNTMSSRTYNTPDCGEVEMLLATYTADVDCAYGLQLACDYIKGPYKVSKSDTTETGCLYDAIQRRKKSILIQNIHITPDSWSQNGETGLYYTPLPIGSRYKAIAVNTDANRNGNCGIKSDGTYIHTSIKPTKDIVISWILCRDVSKTT